MTYRLGPEARRDIESITSYIAERNPLAAYGFADRLRARLELIGKMPEIGVRRDDIGPGLRTFAHGNYLIVYRIERRAALISRVVHGARDISRVVRDGE